jgi:hypothetical protein
MHFKCSYLFDGISHLFEALVYSLCLGHLYHTSVALAFWAGYCGVGVPTFGHFGASIYFAISATATADDDAFSR